MKREGRVHRKHVNVLTAALSDKESLIISLFFRSTREFITHVDTSTLPVKDYKFRPMLVHYLACHTQSPTQGCRSLPSPYNSANLSGFLNNLEKWERIENGLNKRFFFIKENLQKRSPPPPRATLL